MSTSVPQIRQNKSFAVVIFDGSEEASVIPVSWLTQDHKGCFWPDVIGASLSKLIVNPNSTPTDTWTRHNARVLGKYKTLKSARKAEEKSLYTSAVESDSSDPEEPDEESSKTRSRRKQSRRIETQHLDSEEETLVGNAQPILIPPSGLFGPAIACSSGSVPIPLHSSVVEPQKLVTESVEILLENKFPDQYVFQALDDTESLNPSIVKIEASTQTTQRVVNEKFQEVVLKRLADIQITQERILVVVGQQAVVDFEDFDSLPIPCKSPEDLYALEAYLENKENQRKVEKYLASIGGPNLKKAVGSILHRLLTDEFAVIVSFSGKGNAELAFIHFDGVRQTVFRASRRNSSFQHATEDEINSAVKDWLRLAKDRCSGRVHKKKELPQQ